MFYHSLFFGCQLQIFPVKPIQQCPAFFVTQDGSGFAMGPRSSRALGPIVCQLVCLDSERAVWLHCRLPLVCESQESNVPIFLNVASLPLCEDLEVGSNCSMVDTERVGIRVSQLDGFSTVTELVETCCNKEVWFLGASGSSFSDIERTFNFGCCDGMQQYLVEWVKHIC